jgi:hypothetical protein
LAGCYAASGRDDAGGPQNGSGNVWERFFRLKNALIF